MKLVRINEDNFQKFKAWIKENINYTSQSFTIADCQNFYNEAGEVIGKHTFGGDPNMYFISRDIFNKLFKPEDELEQDDTPVEEKPVGWSMDLGNGATIRKIK